MPKIKTRKSVAKRVRVTGKGKIKRMKQFSGCKHIREKKSPKRVRNIRKTVIASPSDVKNIVKCIPYMV